MELLPLAADRRYPFYSTAALDGVDRSQASRPVIRKPAALAARTAYPGEFPPGLASAGFPSFYPQLFVNHGFIRPWDAAIVISGRICICCPACAGKRALFILLLATIMVPTTVTIIPLFIGFSRLGWSNSFLPLIVPSFFANAFYVFLFRQYFRTISSEMFESAELDGCNPLGVYWWIALPLAKPALITVAVFSFIASWNDFLNPLIYLSTNDRFTLSLGLSLFNGLFYTQLQYLMPMSLVALLPVIAIFLLAQRHLVKGIVTTGKY